MKTSDFDYRLPSELIAQTPIEPRDHSRLLVVSRVDGSIEHRHFYDLPDHLRRGDVLVFNDSRVFPARLSATRPGTGGNVDAFPEPMPIGRAEVVVARQHLEAYSALSPRDAIHAAVVETQGLEGIVTTDRALHQVVGLRAFDPVDLVRDA